MGQLIKFVSFDAMKVRLEIKKRVDTVSTPQLLTNIFNKMHQHLSRQDGDSIDWLLPSRPQPQNQPECALDNNTDFIMASRDTYYLKGR